MRLGKRRKFRFTQPHKHATPAGMEFLRHVVRLAISTHPMSLRRAHGTLVPLSLVLGISFSLCMTSCIWMKSPRKRLAEARKKISHKYITELHRQEYKTHQGKLDINWSQALNKMYLTNPELIRADYRIEDARQREKQIWKNMIPGLSVGVYDSFTVENLGKAFSDPTIRINSYLSLGNLLDLPKQKYTARLIYIGSQLQAEQTMRQQVIAIYRLFQQQRLLELEKRALDLEGALVQGISGAESSEIVAMQLKHKEALEKWKLNHRQWKTKVGDFFMAGYDQINLRKSGIPNIRYTAKDLNFADTSRWGILQLNLLALEDISDKGRVLEAYLRYLPRASLSVSAPALYSNTSNDSFDPTLTRLSPAMSWSLDTRGVISQQLHRLKREAPLREWRKDKRQRDEIKKLLEGREALTEIQQELAKLRNAMNGYKQAVSSGLVKDPQHAIQTMRTLREREVRLAAKEIEICSSFWLIDESRWRPITKRWLATRKQRTFIRKESRKQKKQ